jgi:hypothetical protein
MMYDDPDVEAVGVAAARGAVVAEAPLVEPGRASV